MLRKYLINIIKENINNYICVKGSSKKDDVKKKNQNLKCHFS